MTTTDWLSGKAWRAGELARVRDGSEYPVCTLYEMVQRQGQSMARVKLLDGGYRRVVPLGQLRPFDHRVAR